MHTNTNKAHSTFIILLVLASWLLAKLDSSIFVTSYFKLRKLVSYLWKDEAVIGTAITS